MTVIDIDKMPKYGILAAPLPRAERRAGTFIEYDREQQTFVKNRDLLREALEHKRGYLENRPALQWSEFTERQKHRYVPIVPDANRRALPETKGAFNVGAGFGDMHCRVASLPLSSAPSAASCGK